MDRTPASAGLRRPGVAAALAAAALFGAGAPAAKLLLGSISPWLLAGLLYLGAGAGLSLFRAISGAGRVRLAPRESPWLIGAVAFGGGAAPVLLMWGLMRLPAADTSLLLNAETVLTALLAWLVFGDGFDRRVAAGMLAIAAGAVVLGWQGPAHLDRVVPALAVLAACLCWAVDNNFTRKVAHVDASWLACVKGWAAGAVNLAIARAFGAAWPSAAGGVAALAVGWLAYGTSLALFIVGLRHLGAARTSAYFSVAPFFGALLSVVLLREPLGLPLLIASALMATGVWLHLTERHGHEHRHEPVDHDHEHVHDGDVHHQHPHDPPVGPGIRHRHWHRHAPLQHAHAHMPDTHHRHRH